MMGFLMGLLAAWLLPAGLALLTQARKHRADGRKVTSVWLLRRALVVLTWPKSTLDWARGAG